MPECIFCRDKEGPFSTDEHSVPETLGGDERCVLRDAVCDGCQRYFGAQVEQPVLNGPPFLWLRNMARIPSKGRRTPRTPVVTDSAEYAGELSRARPGHLVMHVTNPPEDGELHPGDVIEAVHTPSAADYRLLCRFLLKMGIEGVALGSVEQVLDARYDAAREFARRGTPGTSWSFAVGLLRRDAAPAERDVQFLRHIARRSRSDELSWFRLVMFDFLVPLVGVQLRDVEGLFDAAPNVESEPSDWEIRVV